jgi:integrase
MKAKREHQVPLSEAALALLKTITKAEDTEVVFAGTKGQTLSDMSLTAVIRRMNNDEKPTWVDENGEGITVHGFRSTFRMWAAESTNYPREVAEHALAHQLPDTVERAYLRGSQFSKRGLHGRGPTPLSVPIHVTRIFGVYSLGTRASAGLSSKMCLGSVKVGSAHGSQ